MTSEESASFMCDERTPHTHDIFYLPPFVIILVIGSHRLKKVFERLPFVCSIEGPPPAWRFSSRVSKVCSKKKSCVLIAVSVLVP